MNDFSIPSVMTRTETASDNDTWSPAQQRVSEIIHELRDNPAISQFYVGVEYTDSERAIAISAMKEKMPDREFDSEAKFHHMGTKLRSGSDVEWGFGAAILEELVKFTMSEDPFVMTLLFQSMINAMAAYSKKCLMSDSEDFMGPKIDESYNDILRELIGGLIQKSPLSAICASFNDKCARDGDTNSQTMMHFDVDNIFGSRGSAELKKLRAIADIVHDIMKESKQILGPNVAMHLVKDVIKLLGRDAKLDRETLEPLIRDWIEMYKKNPDAYTESVNDVTEMTPEERFKKAGILSKVMKEAYSSIGRRFRPHDVFKLINELDPALVSANPIDEVALFDAIREIALRDNDAEKESEKEHKCSCENCTCGDKAEAKTIVPGSNTTH